MPERKKTERTDGVVAASAQKWPYRRAVLTVLRFAVTGAVLFLVLRDADFNAMWAGVQSMSVILLVPIALLHVASLALRGSFYSAVLNHGLRLSVPSMTAVRKFAVAASIGVFTPGALGTLSVAGMLKDQGVSYSDGLAAALAHRAMVLLGIVPFAVVGSVLYLRDGATWLWVLAAVCACTIGVVLFLKYVSTRKTAGVFKGFPGAAQQLHRCFAPGLRGWIAYAVLAVGINSAQSLQVWCALALIEQSHDFWTVFWVANIGRFAMFIPLTISGLGIYEGSMAHLLDPDGQENEGVLASMFILRGIVLAVSAMVLVSWAVVGICAKKPPYRKDVPS